MGEYCNADSACLGFTYFDIEWFKGNCELRFSDGTLPAENPGPFWSTWDEGRGVGPIVRVIRDGSTRMCFKKEANTTGTATTEITTAAETTTTETATTAETEPDPEPEAEPE